MPSKPPPLIRTVPPPGDQPRSFATRSRPHAPGHPSLRGPRIYAPSSSYRFHRRGSGRVRVLIALGVVVVLAAAGWFIRQQLHLTTEIEGIEAGAQLRPEAAAGREVRWRVDPASSATAAQVRFDGSPVTDAVIADGTVAWRLPPEVAVGDHTLALTVDRAVVIGRTTRTWTFTVDATPPGLQVTPPAAVAIDQPVTVEGVVEGGSILALAGQPVALEEGRFRIEFPAPPPGPLQFVATDAAGNATTLEVQVPVARPRTAAVHMRAEDWANPAVKAPIDALIAAGKINAVELDVKDENGLIGYQSQVAMARDIGAVTDHYDARAALDELHGKGVRVIGRIVAFRDPVLARAAWDRGFRDAVLQTPTGEMLGAYGGFTNYVNPTVRQYNLALAAEAADLGFDEILWDYIRRPEGSPETMVVPGLGSGASSDYIVSFLAEAQAILRPKGKRQGASVFGIAASRPDSIAQDIPRLAAHVEYLAPMLYPSHWNKGEYDVADPNGDPYSIVKASLADFQRVTSGMPVALVPWLQDFDQGLDYGPVQVQAQIQAAVDLGVPDYLLWNPESEYDADGLAPLAPAGGGGG